MHKSVERLVIDPWLYCRGCRAFNPGVCVCTMPTVVTAGRPCDRCHIPVRPTDDYIRVEDHLTVRGHSACVDAALAEVAHA